MSTITYDRTNISSGSVYIYMYYSNMFNDSDTSVNFSNCYVIIEYVKK